MSLGSQFQSDTRIAHWCHPWLLILLLLLPLLLLLTLSPQLRISNAAHAAIASSHEPYSQKQQQRCCISVCCQPLLQCTGTAVLCLGPEQSLAVQQQHW
jgi:hypothetical protein